MAIKDQTDKKKRAKVKPVETPAVKVEATEDETSKYVVPKQFMNEKGLLIKPGNKYYGINTIHVFECIVSTIQEPNREAIKANPKVMPKSVDISVIKLVSDTPNTLPKKMGISVESLFENIKDAKKKASVLRGKK